MTLLILGISWILYQYLELPLNGWIRKKQILY